LTHSPTIWLAWLESSALAHTMRQWLWLYPAVDLRLLGFSSGIPVAALARHLLPWARTGLGVMALTGTLMFTAHATEFGASPVFRIKLALIAAGCLNAAIFHRWPFRAVARWDVGASPPPAAKAAAAASLVLWTSASPAGGCSPTFSRPISFARRAAGERGRDRSLGPFRLLGGAAAPPVCSVRHTRGGAPR
jgi:hypothetical protein